MRKKVAIVVAFVGSASGAHRHKYYYTHAGSILIKSCGIEAVIIKILAPAGPAATARRSRCDDDDDGFLGRKIDAPLDVFLLWSIIFTCFQRSPYMFVQDQFVPVPISYIVGATLMMIYLILK